MSLSNAEILISALAAKKQAFVREYLVDLNATQAAIRAGYSQRTARAIGAENLTKPDIARAIEVAMAERSRRTEITADRVLQEVAKLAFLDIAGAFNADGSLKALHEIDPDTRAALAGLEVAEITGDEGQIVGRLKKIKLTDKTASLTLLMRHLGMLNDKVKLQGDAENPLALLIKEIQGNAIRPVPSAAITETAE